jgi:hypothetical protein
LSLYKNDLYYHVFNHSLQKVKSSFNTALTSHPPDTGQPGPEPKQEQQGTAQAYDQTTSSAMDKEKP